MNPHDQLARVTALSDQLWISLESSLGDLKRIAEHGPDGSQLDADLIQMALLTVLGELHLRAGARGIAEAEQP